MSQFFRMLYPERLRQDEWIRLVAINKSSDPVTKTVYIKTLDEFKTFALRHRDQYDVYAQIATNRGTSGGSKKSQRQRRVLLLDYDFKDHPELSGAEDCTQLIKNKLPKLFIHACVASGHGYHMYVAIKPSCKISEITAANKDLATITCADLAATSETQIIRIPGTYNHKQANGNYNYDDKDKWQRVTLVTSADPDDDLYHPYDLSYIRSMIGSYQSNERAAGLLDQSGRAWQPENLSECPSYLCVHRVLAEGAVRGQRNFWLGRIVKMMQQDGYQQSKIFAEIKNWNDRCQPPKNWSEVKADTQRYIDNDYKLLGCCGAFNESDPRREWVNQQCDKAMCRTWHNGPAVSVTAAESPRINKKVVTNQWMRRLTGNDYLILTILDVYADKCGRRGFRVRNLKKLLWSSIKKRQAIGDRKLRELLNKMMEQRLIVLTADKSGTWDETKIKVARRLKEFGAGYIQFYWSISNALIDGKITQTDYMVYIALIRNLSDGKNVTYRQIADDLDMDDRQVQRSIKRLESERCLIIEKIPTDRGYECNKYYLIDPESLSDSSSMEIQLLA